MELKPWHRHYDYNVPTTIRYPRLSIPELLGIPSNAYPDKAALTFYGTEMNFWELRQETLRMSNALGALGVKKGDRVGIHLPNCPQYMIAYYAVLSLGAIVVNLNPMYTAEELKLIVGNTGMTTLFTFDMVLPAIRNLCKAVKGWASPPLPAWSWRKVGITFLRFWRAARTRSAPVCTQTRKIQP
jgi:long-chain acyl-CoA synthetase